MVLNMTKIIIKYCRMKTLLTIFVLLFSYFAYAQERQNKISFFEIKILDNLNFYFFENEINKYYVTKPDLNAFAKNKKYSFLHINQSSNIFEEDYDAIQVYYENKTNDIVYTSAIYENIANCSKIKKNVISDFESKYNVSNLQTGEDTTISSDGMKDVSKFYILDQYYIKFSCYFYTDGSTDLRIDQMTYEYNDWIVELWNTISQ